MATTTTNMGWTIPSDTDLVSQGAAAMRTLGNAIDTNVSTLTLRDVSGTTDTLVLNDLKNKLIRYSSTSNVAVTIPTFAAVAFPTGTVVNVIKTGSTGTITIAGDTGVTVTSAASVSASPTITTQYAAASLIKIGTDAWYVIGNIA